ncbi:MAG: dGTP triphosphohydrolase [Thermoanaerobaculales bacterium]
MSSGLIRDRAALERDEERRLALFAIRSSEARRRRTIEEAPSGQRAAFQRDRDRILHARAFRRLKHKTQVFVPHVGDHPRTRLTHTLEVAQLARTIARTLGLNEDLVEAVALGHDLGHTPFGHTGESVLNEILGGAVPAVPLPDRVVAGVGSFKHNYQSLRVVDLLEKRYAFAGLNLTDQVREGILKHTSWKVGYPFPLPDGEGLFQDKPCHLEGQAVAVADEIAQQTHDLEDGLRAGAVRLEEVEELQVASLVISEIGPDYREEASRWQRQNVLIPGLIRLFVRDVVASSASRLERFLDRRRIQDHPSFAAVSREVSQTTLWFSSEVEALFDELKAFIYEKIINQAMVNRQDWRARRVVSALFLAYWSEPRLLPVYMLLRAGEELDLPNLREVPLRRVATTVATDYHASPGFARLIADHIAGMSDRYALEEFRSLEQPSPDHVL